MKTIMFLDRSRPSLTTTSWYGRCDILPRAERISNCLFQFLLAKGAIKKKKKKVGERGKIQTYLLEIQLLVLSHPGTIELIVNFGLDVSQSFVVRR